MKNVVSYFEKQVAKHPNKIAIEYKNSVITYSKLNEKANEFAHYLLGVLLKKCSNINQKTPPIFTFCEIVRNCLGAKCPKSRKMLKYKMSF